MQLDRAVFTSARSLTGQGYRVVAASPGLTSAEKRVISTMSPSHGGMCDGSPDAVGIAFYPLPNGRLCIARTSYAGKEPSGRGGLRLLTEAFAVSRDQLSEVGCNPFAVLRGFPESELPDVSMQSTKTLGMAEIRCDFVSPSVEVRSVLDHRGDDTLCYLVDCATREGCVVGVGVEDATRMMEAVILALPTARRFACTFSIGVTFALGKRLRLHFVGETDGGLLRITRGQPVTIAAGLPAGETPSYDASAWVEMIRDCRQLRRVDDLLALASRVGEDRGDDHLGNLAHRQITLNHLDERPLAEMFEAASRCPGAGDDPATEYLAARISAAARDRLVREIRSADEAFIRRNWRALSGLREVDSRFEPLCAELASRLEEDTEVVG